MDIRVAIASTGIFIAVYAIALGIPFYLYENTHHFSALLFAVFLASVAPFFYARLRREVEDRILRDQTRYQEMLVRSAQELTQIKTVQAIVSSVTEALVKATAPMGVAVYLKDGESYVRKAAFRRQGEYPAQVMDPAAYFHGGEWDGERVFPLMRVREVLGAVVLGPRSGQEFWTDRDIAVIKALIDQAALALENALYVETIQQTQERLIESEKMATVGFLAGGVSHQLKNKFTPILIHSELVADQIRQYRGQVLPEADCDRLSEQLDKVVRAVDSSRDVINGILNYVADRETREPLSLQRLINAAEELIGFKIPPRAVIFEHDIPADLPLVWGNFAQLQEVLFNIIDNAYFSMTEKRAAAPADYQPRIIFYACPQGGGILLRVTDNGGGISPENMQKLFTPLFSTKSAGHKGHGLGLYVMKRIIESHGGTIAFASEPGQGVTITILLRLEKM